MRILTISISLQLVYERLFVLPCMWTFLSLRFFLWPILPERMILANSGAMAFDVDYARWLEEHNRHINELRTAVNAHAGDADLRVIVDNVTAHYNDIFRVKGTAAKADVFHILSGMRKTPAERCFMWIGGFRPSELLKVCVHTVINFFSISLH